MSFDLPASLELDLERYAEAENISPAEAAINLIRSGLNSSKTKASKAVLTAAQLGVLKASPTAVFFGSLSDLVLDEMEAASKQIHSERFARRG